MLLRRIALVASVVLFAAPPTLACKFIASPSPTFHEHAAAADFVLFGRIVNARGTPENGSTDLVILAMPKTHPAVKERAVVTIPRFLPIPDLTNPPLYLVFGDATNGNLDFFHGQTGTLALADYAERVLALDPKDPVKRLRVYFDYLEHTDPAIATDAFREFQKASDAVVSKAAATVTPDEPRRWLRAEGTHPTRVNLYATLLGHCGSRADAALLRQLADKLLKQEDPPQLDGVLAAYTILDPKAGWALAGGLMTDERFTLRYSVLRTVRYFHTTRPDVVPEADRLRVIRLAINQPDMADLPIDDLRKWKCWTLTEDILALPAKPAFQVPIVNRSVLRYALQCPDPEAAKYVAAMRKADPERVKFVEELLKEEGRPSKR